ncbi:distant homolog of phosphate transport system regulator PhoU [Thermococcus kodakarensis KOD1]|uniref:Distant homolog of phosphate transport system regulator PhoU n=1 Tax=Thermococcus kodakarensis (strain ATCC BAA-918 / JCM 12380 / KOD1) TaxID=69014 RepID=Q5JHX5_THEKO|nr:TIGR00153 family protein [Thermococcus kodakarensis]WCN27922.1 TIGR00153 family protein [Thermococcus kodakarensis]WCN30221.1 TIGR00153 family protein [Thermococcus kodakarensis]BAD86249.1 distant homolog of phosphate transport system regulator PhoU [Thermococcus kodakarensis KOD1]
MQVWTKLFAKSPFKPLIKHAEVALQTVETLEKALQAWREGNYEEMKKLALEVDRLEDVADRIKEEIRDSLSSKLMMAVAREDVLIYLHMQDKVADAAEDTAKWLLVKEPGNIPEEIKEVILQMGTESIKAAKLVYEAIVQMDRVIESGFAEKEIEREYEIIHEIEGVESKIDGLDTELMRLVFQNAGRMDWSEGFYILNIARTLSNISDKAKDAAERIRLMMNK